MCNEGDEQGSLADVTNRDEYFLWTDYLRSLPGTYAVCQVLSTTLADTYTISQVLKYAVHQILTQSTRLSDSYVVSWVNQH